MQAICVSEKDDKWDTSTDQTKMAATKEMTKEMKKEDTLFRRGHATYKSPCRSVGLSVRHTLLFLHFWAF